MRTDTRTQVTPREHAHPYVHQKTYVPPKCPPPEISGPTKHHSPRPNRGDGPNTIHLGTAIRGRDFPGNIGAYRPAEGRFAARNSQGARSWSSISTNVPAEAARVSAPGLQANFPGTSAQAYVSRMELLSVWSSRWSSRKEGNGCFASRCSLTPRRREGGRGDRGKNLRGGGDIF